MKLVIYLNAEATDPQSCDNSQRRDKIRNVSQSLSLSLDIYIYIIYIYIYICMCIYIYIYIYIWGLFIIS